ncbi:uncharacterized protein EKO05_0005921 [Ascochyta rabiei]|uniref:Uncharacterized protein n=1 Tax=Didymella rabiei TaxID=5454 RepID=A0A163JKJ9_DIDRA|nr:uncharacterized protein EKO05_0005921 [Ascochyta rabiei]KZM26420.1 hypothetical protein ST47_g2421 [Ascochyta rabiei]UPX15475.1 hypothetical protein EKO05_0005921 [Ascochyta rabiei]
MAGGNHCEAGYLSNAPAAPSTSLLNDASHLPAHPYSHTQVADYKHDATPAASFVTIWTTRLKTHCKKVAYDLIGTFKRRSRQERNVEDAPPLSTSNTWNMPINIIYLMSVYGPEIRRSATGRFDSQSDVDLMSSTYAVRVLGLHFDNANSVPVGKTITGEVVHSIGQVTARWGPTQDATLSSPSGDKITLTAKTYHATFHVIDSDEFDVYIGHPSLVKNGLYGKKPKVLNPFRSYGSAAGPTATSNSAQDQEYLRRVEAERLAVAQLMQQQTQGTSKK